jgi:hypothetical protein
MLAFGIAACIVAVSLTLLMAAVALTVAAIRQSVRVAVKALDAISRCPVLSENHIRT